MDLLFKLRALVEKFSDVFLSVQFYIFLTFFYCSASNHQIKKINKAVVLFSAWLCYGNLDIFLLIDHNLHTSWQAGNVNGGSHTMAARPAGGPWYTR